MARPVSSTRDRQIHLLYGEGPSDAAFLRHLHSLFAPRGEGFQIKTDGNEGGDPVNVLRKCIRYRRCAEYTSRTVLVDTDRPWCPEGVVARARKEGIALLPARPCIEGLLLHILDQQVPPTSGECKRVFHREHMPEAKMMNHRNYQPKFPVDLLASRAPEIPTLAALIRFLESGDPPSTILPNV